VAAEKAKKVAMLTNCGTAHKYHAQFLSVRDSPKEMFVAVYMENMNLLLTDTVQRHIHT
jgi:hypothetical protein